MTDFLTILFFLGLAIILITWIWGMFSGEKLINSTNNSHGGDDVPASQNRELMESILAQLGYKFEIDNDGHLNVTIEGNSFQMVFYGYYIRITSPLCCEIRNNKQDTDILRKAINIINLRQQATAILTDPDENGMRYAFFRYDIMFHPACPTNAIYIQAVFDSMISKAYRDLVDTFTEMLKDSENSDNAAYPEDSFYKTKTKKQQPS
ncbi:MAG: hypothetical protein ACI4A8_03910 [Muribaculaceae bacterium]